MTPTQDVINSLFCPATQSTPQTQTKCAISTAGLSSVASGKNPLYAREELLLHITQDGTQIKSKLFLIIEAKWAKSKPNRNQRQFHLHKLYHRTIHIPTTLQWEPNPSSHPCPCPQHLSLMELNSQRPSTIAKLSSRIYMDQSIHLKSPPPSQKEVPPLQQQQQVKTDLTNQQSPPIPKTKDLLSNTGKYTRSDSAENHHGKVFKHQCTSL